jgi:hypothetical protein
MDGSFTDETRRALAGADGNVHWKVSPIAAEADAVNNASEGAR